MNHSTITKFHIPLLAIVGWLLFSAASRYPRSSPAEAMCPVACQTGDSLALIALYNTTNGPFWKTKWNLNQPVCFWNGVDLDENGFVIEIHLNNNWLVGSLPPEIGDWSQLQYLQLDNNSLSGSIPATIGKLTNVTTVFLDDNDFSGTIPTSMGDLTKLQTLFIDNNQLTGAIPQGFASMVNLMALDIFNNHFDSLPDLSATNLQWNRFGIYNNNFTFDDILPNMGFALNDNYHPQDSFFTTSSYNATTGSYFEIDLGIDAGLFNNFYQWYKNGIPYGAPSNSNKLVFSAIKWSDAGLYHCVVTNPNVPLLTLYSRQVQLNVSCGNSTANINQTLCEGQSIDIQGVIYDKDNPQGSQTLNGADQYGCDSLIVVDLQFVPAAEHTINANLCPRQYMEVNGTTYDQQNPSGTELLSGQAANGCDSVIHIQLNFSPGVTTYLNEQLCNGESINVGGTIFDSDNPSGEITLTAGGQGGCDSTIVVDLQFSSPSSHQIDGSFCAGASFLVNGTVYDENRPSGVEVISNGNINGCDSTIYIDLLFVNQVEYTLQQQLCDGASLVINGTTYNNSNPNGTEVLTGAAANGCDSLIHVDLSFSQSVTTQFNPWLCMGESVVINGSTYDIDQPRGSELFTNASQLGCDSLVQIELHFYPPATSSLSPTLCQGESIVINGTTYNSANEQGTEVLIGAAANGCDSIIQVALAYYPPSEGELNTTLCSGDHVVVNGTVYDENNPSGTEVLSSASMHGCDSVLQIVLDFQASVTERIFTSLCSGEQLIVNGNLYDESNPQGTEVISSGSVFGCDSVILVELSFWPVASSNWQPDLCSGESISINGQTYDENLPSGVETLNNASINGCDSTVYIEINFHSQAEGWLEKQLCNGSSININGTLYDENNPSGTEVLTGQSSHGCDSTLHINLEFVDKTEETFDWQLCEGEELLVNGTIYDANNPAGTETIAAGNMQGCDSIIHIDLQFVPHSEFIFQQTLCSGELLMVNGHTYDQQNPTGTELLSGQAANGCDSTVFVQLGFHEPAENYIQQQLCNGSSININGTLYDESNPSGTEVLTGQSSHGCDSTLHINLEFVDKTEETFDWQLCEGEELLVNGTIYDANNPAGTETIAAGNMQGCDSIIHIDLQFVPHSEFIFQQTLCSGELLMVNGHTYDQQNPTGTELLSGQAANGCDSTVFVQLGFHEPAENYIQQQLCSGAGLWVNGNWYDESQPEGIEILTNASVNGCDSTIYVQLSFHQQITENLQASICRGESFLLNGQTYQQSGQYSQQLVSVQGCDSLLLLDLVVMDAATLGAADAGPDVQTCSAEVQLQANLPPGTIGQWLSNSSTSFSDIHDPESLLSQLTGGANELVWSLSSGQCADYDRDTLIIWQEVRPDARDDAFELPPASQSFSADLLANDELDDVAQWDMEWVELPAVGQVNMLPEGWMSFELDQAFAGTIQFSYKLCNLECANLCDTAVVDLRVEESPAMADTLVDIPNGITPNGDGLNEFFVFPMLEHNPERFPQRELIIFNRWGNIVYQTQKYQNNWGGEASNGQALPQGTYYYVLRLDIADGIIYKGDISIIR